MENRKILLIIGGVLILMMACVACFALTGVGAFFFAHELDQNSGSLFEPEESATAGPTPVVTRGDDLPSSETLELLQDTIVPENNKVELAERLLGIANIPNTVDPPARPYQVGDRRTFWVTDTSTDQTFQTGAILRYLGDTIYFWIEDGVGYDEGELNLLAHTFEDEIVPTTRDFFGNEWSPGIDNDPHIYILYTTNVGITTAGYFSSADSLHPLAHEFSNAVEMFVLNADNSPLSDRYTYAVLAHEFQHMIHWYRDRNETSWLNEGLSELSTLLNEYAHTGFGSLYTSNPDLQLNDWPTDSDDSPPHYGAGFLFSTYFLERFGNEATQSLVANTANGLESVDNVLNGFSFIDPLSGNQIKADDVVLDWMISNYLLDGSVADGRYTYPNYTNLVSQAQPTERISDCTVGAIPRDVHQYGVDYISITCDENASLRFEGSTQTALLPTDPYSGEYYFWSNKGDESDMTLTQAFDFTGVSGPLTFDFRTWFDIELDWDYLYFLTSTDGGSSWDFLTTPSGTDTDPNGNSYGWALTGFSGGGEDEGFWIEESVDLSAYAGKEMLLRFEYITDAAVNGEGLLLDDVRIDAIGYSSNFESDNGGWEAEGFARVQNILPQNFRLALISHGEETTVQILEIEAGNSIEIDLDFDGDVDEYTLVIMGATRFTRQSAAYRIIVESP
jgi:immune inhibitor A